MVAIRNQTRGAIVKGKSDIAREFANYYAQLYSSDNNLCRQNTYLE